MTGTMDQGSKTNMEDELCDDHALNVHYNELQSIRSSRRKARKDYENRRHGLQLHILSLSEKIQRLITQGGMIYRDTFKQVMVESYQQTEPGTTILMTPLPTKDVVEFQTSLLGILYQTALMKRNLRHLEQQQQQQQHGEPQNLSSTIRCTNSTSSFLYNMLRCEISVFAEERVEIIKAYYAKRIALIQELEAEQQTFLRRIQIQKWVILKLQRKIDEQQQKDIQKMEKDEKKKKKKASLSSPEKDNEILGFPPFCSRIFLQTYRTIPVDDDLVTSMQKLMEQDNSFSPPSRFDIERSMERLSPRKPSTTRPQKMATNSRTRMKKKNTIPTNNTVKRSKTTSKAPRRFLMCLSEE